MDKPYVKITMNPDDSSMVEIHGMTPLHMTYCSMVMLDKVYESLKAHGNLEMAEVVGSILQSVAALVQLAATPTPGEMN